MKEPARLAQRRLALPTGMGPPHLGTHTWKVQPPPLCPARGCSKRPWHCRSTCSAAMLQAERKWQPLAAYCTTAQRHDAPTPAAHTHLCRMRECRKWLCTASVHSHEGKGAKAEATCMGQAGVDSSSVNVWQPGQCPIKLDHSAVSQNELIFLLCLLPVTAPRLF